MATTDYNATEEMADLDGNGGTVGGSNGTPGSGPLQLIQDGDPYTWEVHYQGQGSTQQKHGLFGKILNSILFLWRFTNLVRSLGGTYQYSGAQFGLGLSGLIHAATNASPIVCTVDDTESMRAGAPVTITGATGNTAMNGTWRVQVLSSTQFALQGSTGNGTYTVDSATARWAGSLWYYMKFLADFAALTNKAQTFNGNQTFANNVTVNGTLTAPTFTPGVVQPTGYYGAPIVDAPAYTGGGGGQIKTIGDAVGGGVDIAIAPVIRFSNWGGSGENDSLTLNLAAHGPSDNPMFTIIFDPISTINAAGLLVQDVQSGNTVFSVGSTGGAPGIHNCGSGSLTVAWKSGVGYRLVSWAGFIVAPATGAGLIAW